MVKIFFLCIMILSLNANTYKTNCVKCHNKLPVSIDKYFYRYLLKYSSENSVKKAMFEYLQNPTIKKTIMPKAFIKRFSIKKPSLLNEKQLKININIYWETYKIFDKLK